MGRPAEAEAPPVFDLATLGPRGKALHVVIGRREAAELGEPPTTDALCGAFGLAAVEELGVDARAVRVRGRDVCGKCLAVLEGRTKSDRRDRERAYNSSRYAMRQRDATERRATGNASSSDGRPGRSRPPIGRENDMPARAGQKRSSDRRPPRRARSAVATAPAAAAEKKAPEEKGTAILDALLKALKSEGVAFDQSPNKSATYTRLRVDGKAFAYIFPPRPGSVAVKIPKQLLGVASKLPKDHGFKRTEWGLTRTLSTAKDAPVVAKAFAVAAAAVVPAEEGATAS
jgi:hypothetical protein